MSCWKCNCAFALCFVASAPSSIAGPFLDGNMWLNYARETGANRSLALGYVAAVNDVFTGMAVCAPEGVTLGQLVDVSRKYLENMPQKRHLPADDLILEALQDAFPCPKKR